MERHAEVSTQIARPVEDVWAVASDVSRTPEWRTTIVDITPPEGSLGRGSRFGAKTKVLGRHFDWTIEVAEWQPPHRITLVTVEGLVKMGVSYVCEPDGDETRFTFIGSGGDTDSTLLRILGPLFAATLRREARQHVQNLKALVEDQ